MSATRWQVGMPIPLVPPPTELEIACAGEFEKGEGMQIVIVGERLVVRSRMEGCEGEASCGLEELIEAVCRYNRERGN